MLPRAGRPWLSLRGSGPGEAAQLPRGEEALCWAPATPPNTTMPGDSGGNSPPSSPGQPDLGRRGGGTHCPGGGRRTLLLVVECSLGVVQNQHCVLLPHTHYVKIHSAFLPLPDTIMKRHLCKGQSFFLGWETLPLLCSGFPAQIFPENGLSREEEVGRRCPLWEEGTSPPPPSADSLDPTSPGQGGKRSALCLHVLLLPWKTQPSVTRQRSTGENKITSF